MQILPLNGQPLLAFLQEFVWNDYAPQSSQGSTFTFLVGKTSVHPTVCEQQQHRPERFVSAFCVLFQHLLFPQSIS